MPEPTIILILDAFTYDPVTFEIQDKGVGIGDVATSRVAVINVPDDQGTYKQVPTGTIAYHGARYVGDVAYADDGAGTLLDPRPYAVVATEATNLCKSNNNFAIARWQKVNITLEGAHTDIFGGDTGRKLVGTSGLGSKYMAQESMGLVAGQRQYITLYVKHDDADYVWIQLNSYQDVLEASIVNVDLVLLTNSAFRLAAGNGIGAPEISINEIVNSWIEIKISYDVLAPGSGLHLLFGPADSMSVTTFTGDGVKGFLFCYPQVSHTNDVFYPIKTPNDATVTRDKDEITVDSANLANAAGTIIFDTVQPTDGDNGVISQFLNRVSGVYRMTDGTTQIDSAVVDGSLQVGMVWGNGVMDLAINGVWIGEQAYDGTLPDGILDLFRDSAYVQRIMNLKIYDDADKGLIA